MGHDPWITFRKITIFIIIVNVMKNLKPYTISLFYANYFSFQFNGHVGLPNYVTCTVWSIFRTLSLYHNELFVGHCRSQTSVPKVWLRHSQSLLVHTVVNNKTMQKIVHIQTLPNLHHSYVLDGKSNFAQLGMQHTSGQLRMSIQSSPTLQAHWNLIGCNMTALPPVLSNSKILLSFPTEKFSACL